MKRWIITGDVQGSCTLLPGYVYEENGTYKASEDAVAGKFYKYNDEWFYVAVDKDELKSKTDLWNDENYSGDASTRLNITGENGTYQID